MYCSRHSAHSNKLHTVAIPTKTSAWTPSMPDFESSEASRKDVVLWRWCPAPSVTMATTEEPSFWCLVLRLTLLVEHPSVNSHASAGSFAKNPTSAGHRNTVLTTSWILHTGTELPFLLPSSAKHNFSCVRHHEQGPRCAVRDASLTQGTQCQCCAESKLRMRTPEENIASKALRALEGATHRIPLFLVLWNAMLPFHLCVLGLSLTRLCLPGGCQLWWAVLAGAGALLPHSPRRAPHQASGVTQ